jgi:hypothetical protein
MISNAITAEQAADIRARVDRYREWVKGRNRNNYKPDEVPTDCRVSNDEQSTLEVYDFVNEKPERYFLYIREEMRQAITWTGDLLGSVSFGHAYRDNFGGLRVPIRIHAINGRTYAGTYYKSAGDYARVKAVKSR